MSSNSEKTTVIPKKYRHDDSHVIGLWHHAEDACGSTEAMSSPWDTRLSPARPEAQHPVLVIPELPRPEFTAECWYGYPPGRSRSRVRETLLRCDAEDAPVWTLALDENLCLAFSWQDRCGATAMCTSRPLTELVLDGGWYHLAVSFQNPCAWFEDDGDAKQNLLWKESCVRLYCTRSGVTYPETVGALEAFVRPHIRTAAATVTIGDGDAEGSGVLAEVVISNIAKLENQFFALCPPLPASLKPSAAIACGSGRDWTINEQGAIEFCGGSDGRENTFWFHFRLDGEPGPVTFCFNPSGNRRMANAAYLSYDRVHWTRIRDARFTSSTPRRLPERARGMVPERMSLVEGSAGQLRFSVEVTQTPAYIAGGIPYLIRDVHALEADLDHWELFRCCTIGQSGGRRPIRGWRITDFTIPDDRKQRIVLINGQHSPYEIQVGWALDAMVREIAGSTQAREALKRLSLVIVPIVNMDAAAEGGNTSLSRNGVNLNRDWFALQEPETAAVAAFIDDASGGKVDLCLDMHGSGPSGNHFLMGTVPEALSAISPGLARRQRRAQDLLCRHLGIRPDDNHRLRSLAPNGKSIWGNGLDKPNLVNRMLSLYDSPAFTVEINAFVQSIDPPGVLEPMSRRAYATLGKALLNVCLEWMEWME